MGWATAWSFDRLRLWLETGIPPRQTMRQTLAHAVARVALALIFAYHGLVPKLLIRHADEVAMLRDAGLAASQVGAALTGVGIAELALALCLLAGWHRRWPPRLALALMLIATMSVAINSPRYLIAAFNPLP